MSIKCYDQTIVSDFKIEWCVCCWEAYMPILTPLFWAVLKICTDQIWCFFFFFKVMHLIWKYLSSVNFFLIWPWNHFTQNTSFKCWYSPFFISEKFQQEKWNVTVLIKNFHDTHPYALSPVHYALSTLGLDWCQFYNQY